jgi:hypothetical protein
MTRAASWRTHGAEHDAPGAATLQVLQGRMRLATSEERWEFGSGRPPADPTHPAPVGELGGRCSPVDRRRGTIQLRETPGNLSGSKSETHQHFSPAGANCCHSLLLDPDATISIDLREPLFLLVTGRGESPPDFPYHGCALPTELGGRDKDAWYMPWIVVVPPCPWSTLSA